MIELASEAVVQQVARTDQNQVLSHKDTVENETQKVVADRPIEKSEEAAEAKAETEQDESQTRYNLDHNRIVIEKYDENGELILQLPSVHSDDV